MKVEPAAAEEEEAAFADILNNVYSVLKDVLVFLIRRNLSFQELLRKIQILE